MSEIERFVLRVPADLMTVMRLLANQHDRSLNMRTQRLRAHKVVPADGYTCANGRCTLNLDFRRACTRG